MGEPHSHPSHPDYIPSVFAAVYQSNAKKIKLEQRGIAIKKRQAEFDQQHSLEEEHRKEVGKEFCSRMEYLQAEGECLQLEYEEALEKKGG